MRYIEVTHTYILPLPTEDAEAIDAIAAQGMSIMEGMMKGQAANIQELRSDWKMLPKEYRPQQPVQELVEHEQEGELTFEKGQVPEKVFEDTPRERDRIESLRVIEADADQGISFTGDVMGQRPKAVHPWMQGLRIHDPSTEDIGPAETEALRQEGMLCGHLWPTQDDKVRECVLVIHHPGPHLYKLQGESDARRQIDA